MEEDETIQEQDLLALACENQYLRAALNSKNVLIEQNRIQLDASRRALDVALSTSSVQNEDQRNVHRLARYLSNLLESLVGVEDTLESDIQDIKSTYKQCVSLKFQLDRTREVAKHTNETLRKEIDIIVASRDVLDAQNEKLLTENGAHLTTIDNLKNEVQVLTNNYNEMEEQFKILGEENSEFSEKVKILEEKNEADSNKVTKLSELVNDMEKNRQLLIKRQALIEEEKICLEEERNRMEARLLEFLRSTRGQPTRDPSLSVSQFSNSAAEQLLLSIAKRPDDLPPVQPPPPDISSNRKSEEPLTEKELEDMENRVVSVNRKPKTALRNTKKPPRPKKPLPKVRTASFSKPNSIASSRRTTSGMSVLANKLRK